MTVRDLGSSSMNRLRPLPPPFFLIKYSVLFLQIGLRIRNCAKYRVKFLSWEVDSVLLRIQDVNAEFNIDIF